MVAIGPLPMMRAVCNLLTKEHNIETMISMNPIMIDGTGMCGGCRLDRRREKPSLPVWTGRTSMAMRSISTRP